MFRRFILWLSHLWAQLCEFTMPSRRIAQTPSTPAPDVVDTTTNPQTQRTFVSTSTTTQTPSTSVPNAMATTTGSQTQLTIVSSSTHTKYDVFLSFRGEDTRRTFTGHLYDKLDTNGIRTFKDDPELRSGEVISDALLDAIRSSKTYIVVFSEKYATSPWCLDELAEILSCHRTMQRWVIPVFFNIDPSVVRHQTGSFQKAFEKHKKRFRDETEKLENWQLTLKEVAGFSGHHVSKDRSEADVINEIVDELLLKINPKTLDVAKYPVGLDYRVEAITRMLSSDTNGVIRIGIHGMGGVGKTTLAKAVYNKHYRSFDGSCFLADVREASTRENGLVSLQQKLIDNVLKRKNENERIDNVDQGIELIRARICSKKVLIVLDDLDNIRPLEFIVGPFAMGSVIIITTRNEDLLDSVRVEARYKVTGLGDIESRQLFMQHAFGDDKKPDTFTELSQEILEHAGGLPLAIKVFGSNLLNQPEGHWRWFINKLKRVPIEDVENKLKISYQALKSVDPMLQNIYLDIACVFVGCKKKEVVYLMETCYTFVDRHIDILNKRCLLTTNDKDELEMHDLLQDMGRNIARNESPDEPEKHSRLWVSKDICDVLKKKKGTEAIECIIPRDNNQDALEGLSLTTKTFESMSKLRFLYLPKGVNITGSFEQIFEDLRLLCWMYCPLQCLPSEFHPSKLVILDLPYSKLRTVWEQNMVSHVFGKLKTLNMSCSRDLVATPDFNRLPSLESLDLESCESLEEVHISIGSLERLGSLNLKGCKKLRSLPDTICDLRALKVLNISWCNSLEALPDELWKITRLRELDARHSDMLKRLPDIGSGQIALPLQELKLSFSGIIALPSGFSQLSDVQSLDLRYCKHLLYIPKLPPNLKRINASHCKHLEKLPNLSNLKHLEELDLECCSRLTEILGSEDLTSLRKIKLAGCKNLETLRDTMCNLRSLETLSIENCKKLQALPDELWKNTRLRELNARGADMLKKLPDIGLGQIAISLREWKFSFSGIIALPSGFSQLSNLQSLHLTACFRLLSIPKLPPNLKWIKASHCDSLERLPNLSNLKQLEILDLKNCIRLTNIQGLEDLISIRSLDLRGLTHRHLPKRLFKVYSEFGHEINVRVSEFIDEKTHHQWLDWTSESSLSESSFSESTTMYADLLPNESHNFMGIILCFQRSERKNIQYSVKNTTSGFVWRSDLNIPISGSLVVIVPKSIFSVTDADHRIELTTHDYVKFVRIHLLYNTETETAETIEDVVEKHAIHIDALKLIDPVLLDIFLDIACFFIGWQEKRVVQILETYYTNVDHNIDILKTRCLLKINEWDELEMDHLFQYLGRKLAHNNTLEEPEKLSRLWLLTDIYDVLKKHKGTEVSEGIVPCKVYYWDRDDALTGESFTLEAFKKMRKLRFLYLRKVHLTGSFEQTFQDLRWLCWDWCPLKCLPSEFYPPKLVILELRHSNITTMWELTTVPHVFEKLKTLDMSDSEDLTTTPDFTKLPCLETLNLKGCESLEEVHISIGSLSRLVSLYLHGCVKLRSLPDTICNLRALEVLDICDCCCLQALPMSLGNIQSLREFNAGNLTVSVLPDSIGHLSKLVNLRLNSNKKLKTLPDTICNLRSLEILDICGCKELEFLPDELWKLTRLRKLNASGATFLQYIPNIDSSQIALLLQKLDLSNSLLTALPFGICQLAELDDLRIVECCDLLSIEELPPNLKRIEAYECTSLERLPNLSNLKQLEILDLTNCIGLTEILGLEVLTSLRELRLGGCNSSLLAYIFTKSLFQMYSQFGHSIQICSTEFPDWISQSSGYESNEFCSMSLNLPPNVSHNYLGMILCIRSSAFFTSYSIQKTTSDFIWTGEFGSFGDKSLMVVVPRSTFSVEDGDDRIVLKADRDAQLYVHLLYKTEEYDSTTVNEN